MNNKAEIDLIPIAEQFAPFGKVSTVKPFGSGNINDTFLVTIDSRDIRNFILQRLNTHVFKKPELVMRNMRTVIEHIKTRLKNLSMREGRRYEIPSPLPARDGRDYFIDSQGSFWRAMSFIEMAETFDTIQNSTHAEEVGFALGMFHGLVSDLPPETLSDTLVGFHITPSYLSHYDYVIGKTKFVSSHETDYCVEFIENRRLFANALEDAKKSGKIKKRIIHGDPKINNIMIDSQTRKAVCMIDLDTVNPGLVHYDIGDCLRSACNPMGEEVENWESVSFDTELCKSILGGYFGQARDFLSEADYEYVFDSVRLIAFELGLRFFTDYLEGNVYFKTKYDCHNLIRALCQFRLAESVEKQEASIRAIVGDYM